MCCKRKLPDLVTARRPLPGRIGHEFLLQAIHGIAEPDLTTVRKLVTNDCEFVAIDLAVGEGVALSAAVSLCLETGFVEGAGVSFRGSAIYAALEGVIPVPGGVACAVQAAA